MVVTDMGAMVTAALDTVATVMAMVGIVLVMVVVMDLTDLDMVIVLDMVTNKFSMMLKKNLLPLSENKWCTSAVSLILRWSVLFPS